MYAVLHAGLAKGHRGNPAASLKIETVFAIPVLLSGADHKGGEDH